MPTKAPEREQDLLRTMLLEQLGYPLVLSVLEDENVGVFVWPGGEIRFNLPIWVPLDTEFFAKEFFIRLRRPVS